MLLLLLLPEKKYTDALKHGKHAPLFLLLLLLLLLLSLFHTLGIEDSLSLSLTASTCTFWYH